MYTGKIEHVGWFDVYNFRDWGRDVEAELDNLQRQISELRAENAQLRNYLGVDLVTPDCKPVLRKKGRPGAKRGPQ